MSLRAPSSSFPSLVLLAFLPALPWASFEEVNWSAAPWAGLDSLRFRESFGPYKDLKGLIRPFEGNIRG